MVNLNSKTISNVNKNKILKIIKINFEKDEINKIFYEQNFWRKIEELVVMKKENIEHWNKEELYIPLCIISIDSQNWNIFDYLYNYIDKNNRKNIVNEIYNLNFLTPKRLEFILEKKNSTIVIPSPLIRTLFQKKEFSLLNIFFKYSKFYDNKVILEFCSLHKNKNPISTFELRNIISNDNYIVETNGEVQYPFEYNQSDLNKIDKNMNGNYLFRACIKGKKTIVKYLVEHGADVNRKCSPWYDTPFVASCRLGHEDIVKYLIMHGADFKKDAPLVAACKSGNENLVKYLIELGVDVNQLNKNGQTPLSISCKYGYENVVKYLVKHGANILRDKLLIAACKSGNENLVKYLVELGIDINQINEYHQTPLSISCTYGYESIVKYLYEHGAIIEPDILIHLCFGLKPIIHIYKKYDDNRYKSQIISRKNIIKYFIEHGVNVKGFGTLNSPLQIISQSEETEDIIECLVEHGADINEGIRTPLCFACKNGNVNIVKYLVKLGADVNKGSHGEEPLFIACKEGYKTIVKYLIKHGADLSYIDELLLIACDKGYEDIVKCLIEHGANVNTHGPLLIDFEREYRRRSDSYRMYYRATNNNYRGLVQRRSNIVYNISNDYTPLQLAFRSENENIIEYLIKKGAHVNQNVISVLSKIEISNAIKAHFENDDINKIFNEQIFWSVIEKQKIINSENIKNWNKEELYIILCVIAIDSQNLEIFDYLYNNYVNNKNKNIINEIYRLNFLTPERLEFILEKKNSAIVIPSPLIKTLLQNITITPSKLVKSLSAKDEIEIDLLDIIFKYSKFYDNEAILELCRLYKNKKPTPTSELQTIVSNNKYIVETNGEIQYPFENSINITNRNVKGNYLFRACAKGKETIVKYLVEHGADVNFKFFTWYDTPFVASCRLGHENIVKYLVHHGADMNKDAPLVAACKSGNENLVKYLVEHGVNVNQKNKNDLTPLRIFCRSGNETMVNFLYEHGATIDPILITDLCLFYNYDISYYDKHVKHKSESLLNDRKKMIKYLVDHGASVHKYEDCNSPLMILSKYEGTEDIIRYLVKHGANVNEKNSNCKTPLYIACENGNAKVVRCLVELGAHVKKGGEEPLYIACEKGFETIVKYLVDHGANLKFHGPLSIACEKGYETIAKYLIKHGALVNYNNGYDDYNYTPLQLACYSGNKNIVKCLIKHGANIDQGFENTTLPFAIQSQNVKLVKYLMKQKKSKIRRFLNKF